MGKLILLALIILIAFWVGRLTAGAGKNKIDRADNSNDSNIIDIELEDDKKSD